MNEIVINIISIVVTSVVLPIISLLGAKLVQLINNKIKDEKGTRALDKATEVVINAVRCVFQTYVEALKDEGKFDADAQLIALNKAKDIVLSELSQDVKDYIQNDFGDLSAWIINQIEASINVLKNR